MQKRLLILQKWQTLLTVNDEKYKIMSKYFQGGNYNEIDKMEKLIGKLIGKMWKCVSFGSSICNR